MGSFRVISHESLGQKTLAVLSVATTIFSFRVGLFIITIADLVGELFTVIQHIKEQKYKKAGEEALQILASGLYLSFMTTGALEAILFSTLMQAVICLYQSRQEMVEGKYLEAFAKVALSGVRLYQVNNYRVLIQRRNQIFAIEKYQELIERLLKAKKVRHLLESPLADLEGNIEKNQVTLLGHDFGSHFHGYGKGLVKGANLGFRRVVVEGKELTELQFKVNHLFREKLFEGVDGLESKERMELLGLIGSQIEDVNVSEDGVLSLKGLGFISFGKNPQVPNLYDRVIIQMEPDKTIYDLHEMLSFTNLEEALYQSSQEDLDRLKMGHLFRTFFPKEALPFERSEEFFTLSLKDLKIKMIEKAPGMKEIYEDYFDRMSASEILPGKVRYRIEGLADKVAQCGGRVLTAAVTGVYYDDQKLYERVASMLQIGMISHELKDTYDFNARGLGGVLDYMTGGADSVYMQMLTDKNVEDHLDLSSLYYSKARMLIDLTALESGTYQYYDDSFGVRLYDTFSWWQKDKYLNHPNILEFIEHLQHPAYSWQYDRNEVMVKERLDPKFFTGIILDNEKTREGLLSYLRTSNLVQKDSIGNETILNIDVNRFLRVGKYATNELLGP